MFADVGACDSRSDPAFERGVTGGALWAAAVSVALSACVRDSASFDSGCGSLLGGDTLPQTSSIASVGGGWV